LRADKLTERNDDDDDDDDDAAHARLYTNNMKVIINIACT
jgi:hypothetical protein